MFTPILADFYKVKFEKEFASNFVCHWFLQAEILIIFCKKDLVDQGSRVECILVKMRWCNTCQNHMLIGLQFRGELNLLGNNS